MEKARTISTFDQLIEMDEGDLRLFGIESQEVISKILLATQNWKNEHQLPGNFKKTKTNTKTKKQKTKNKKQKTKNKKQKTKKKKSF